MYLKLKRTQKTKIGRLAAGVSYFFDPAKPGHTEVAESLLNRKMAVKTSKAAIEKEAKDAEAQARAHAAGETGGVGVAPAVVERAAVLAQEVEEAAKKKAADDKAKAEKAAAEKAKAEKAGGETGGGK